MEEAENLIENYTEYMTLSALPEAVIRQCSRVDTGAVLLKKGHEYLKSGEAEKAVECYKGAAKKGEADAYFALSVCYEFGIGMQADLKQADAMFEKAARLRKQGIYEVMGAEAYIDSRRESRGEPLLIRQLRQEKKKQMNHENQNLSQSPTQEKKKCIMSGNFKNILFPSSSLTKERKLLRIKHIVFEERINDKAYNSYYKDISASGDGSVIGWIEDVTLHIAADGKVTAPADCRGLFRSMNVETIVCNNAFDTGQVTDMRWMFCRCRVLTKLDLSGFDTGKVKDMRRMFFGCENLTKLDLSGFDTGHVIDMSSMFADCENLIKLDLSGFDTRLVADMSSMFSGCRNLTELDLSSFDTRLVLDMRSMFSQCRKLTNLYINGYFGNGSIKENMFDGCYTLLQQLKTAGKY